jgi:predicted aspartyl protease
MRTSPTRTRVYGAILCLCLMPAAATAAAGTSLSARIRAYQKRIDDCEAVIAHFYRGESITEAHTRVNDLVDDFNTMVDRKNAQLDTAKKKLDEEKAPLQALSTQVDTLDRILANRPDPSDRNAVLRYNALVEQRNTLVATHNELNKAVRRKIETYNALVSRTEAEIDAARIRLAARKAEVKSKYDAYESLRDSDSDVAFYEALNRLYADLTAEARANASSKAVRTMLGTVRALRRELGEYAVKMAASRENGLVIIEAELTGSGPEPFWFILDTGAMQTTITREMVDALGLTNMIGEETKLVLAGGKKISGNRITIPAITVSGHTERDVTGVVVKASDVGVDGLLGQSFLKAFIYTVNETQKQKLILKRRPHEK